MRSRERPSQILNVNDDPGSRYLSTRILARAGYQVIEAETGEEALRLTAQQLPELVILDVKLPDMDGYAVCRKLKADPRTAAIPVLHTSATFVTPDKRVRGLDSGADAYLTQPVEEPELLATVRALLRIRRAEENAGAAAREWQASFDAISDGMCLLDRGGTVVRSNKAFAALLDDERAVPGHRLTEVLRTALGPGAPSLDVVQATGRRDTAELLSRGRNLRVDLDPIFDDEGGFAGAVVIVSDVTARRRLEQELRLRAEDLAERDRRKDEFLAMLAHELRNPLNAALGALHLQDELHPDPPEGLRRVREVVHRQVRHLTRLVDDLLDVSRVTRGMIELRQEVIDVASAVRQAEENARGHVEAQRHTLRVSVPVEPISVRADPTRLDQILQNLLVNAARYTEPGGKIWLDVEREGDRVFFRVRDTGIGIEPDVLPHIFDLFTQSERSLDRAQGGLGIGLTLAQRLVELHGGEIQARSEGAGRGSEFEVWLPVCEAQAAPPAELDAGRPATAAPLSVLVVEDNADSRLVLVDLLRRWGHEVDAACDGSEGLEAVLQLRPDVALVDVGLPGVDGYELARRIHARLDGQRPYLVAMTGYGRNEDRSEALAAGFDVHLVKPVNPRELAGLLTSLSLERRAS